ncbi:MAG: helix-turn-helix domain-containing protein [Chloroflexota bacterium]
MSGGPEFSQSSGNVFADLGLAEPDTLPAKAELVRRISAVIRQRRLTQARTAALLGIDQPKVSALLSGNLSGFSTDRLLRFLLALDQDVEIRVRTKPRSRARAELVIAGPDEHGDPRAVTRVDAKR